MYGIETINAMNEQAQQRANKLELQPWTPGSIGEVESLTSYPFPNLGGIPDGWEETASWFVDSSGFGQAGESALTVDQFQRGLVEHARANPDDGYAITEEGQFQLWVSALRRV